MKSLLAPHSPTMRALAGLRTVALFEAAKGALEVLAGFGVFALIGLRPPPVSYLSLTR